MLNTVRWPIYLIKGGAKDSKETVKLIDRQQTDNAMFKKEKYNYIYVIQFLVTVYLFVGINTPFHLC